MNYYTTTIVEQIIYIARIAGLEIMKIYSECMYSKINMYEKSDNTPVTDADLLSHEVIVYFLRQLTPNIPIISEEQVPSWKECKNWNYFWLIDPLDGTKEFLLRNGEFTVNIAFIRNGDPIIGIVYVPAYNVLYMAVNDQAWKINSCGELYKISAKQSKYPVVLLSRNNIDDNQHYFCYLNSMPDHVILKIGSSLKFCLIAEGLAQIYLRFSFTKIWDTAAGHAIAKASGALINDWNGYPLHYKSINKNFLNPYFQVSLY